MAEEKQGYEGTAHEADLTVDSPGGHELNWDLPVMGDAASSSDLDDASATGSADEVTLGDYPDYYSSADLKSDDMSPHSFEADLGNLVSEDLASAGDLVSEDLSSARDLVSEDLSSAGDHISEDLSSAGDDVMSEDLASAGDETFSTEDPVSGGDEPVELI
ncbi:hypothetical protein [Mycobacterium sp.]|uniref:hypothetical protein n=1 Tax=Mycobacterium sp. TaxID=1785 RepID=UPI003F96C8AC